MNTHALIQRHSASERLNHWLVALTFVLAGLSGLGFFHPVFFWLTGLFGGGTWARILHPFFGAVLALSFFVWAGREWKDNRIVAADWQWAKRMGDVLRNRTDNLPPLGKYNLGQKLLTRTMLVAILLLLASGILIWQPWFAPEFAIAQRRIAVVVHAGAAFVALIGFIVHVYAAYWTRGSIRAMTRGTVTRTWARHHSADWYKKIAE
ncbi:MAG: formate dehydrogenase subunit gamma [Desulfobulbus sp.]|jgi:formate dehydrogenase subunit gamma|uniref:formate dehydrogenase subunit gamma n=1 Tax=Desulfobulbus sp. TaxID=895 RepID=UPI00284BC47D|nr:formate dehydrogenase subunit gamma [Desulfobulbus sp.]MDR2549553.1 formate dehydrogenase subunit gamma [Desulfobulbus sp.]